MCPMVFKVIHQIWRSHGTTNRQFWPELSISGLYLQFEFTSGFEMLHKAWCGIEEVPYLFIYLFVCVCVWSFTKFQSHTGWNIDDLNPICVRLLRPVAAIKSLRFALFTMKCEYLTRSDENIKTNTIGCYCHCDVTNDTNIRHMTLMTLHVGYVIIPHSS